MRLIRLTAALALAGAALVGCASEPLTEAPAGLDVSVYQTRFDANARQLQFHFENRTGAAVTITSARLDSRLHDSPVQWQGESTVENGRARDLKAQLPDAACPRAAEPGVLVTFDFVLPDGRPGSATVVPADPMEILPNLTVADCLQSALEKHASVDIVAVEFGREHNTPATLTIRVTPRQSGGELYLQSIEGTNLLALLDADGQQVEELPLDIRVAGTSGEQEISLRLEPTRCDPHAVAEDKQGTLFPVVFSTGDGETGKVRLATPDALRAQLYAFVGTFCQF